MADKAERARQLLIELLIGMIGPPGTPHHEAPPYMQRDQQRTNEVYAALEALVADLENTRQASSQMFVDAEIKRAAAETKANNYRIEADCALRDCDGMELELGLMRERVEALETNLQHESMMRARWAERAKIAEERIAELERA